MYVKFCAGRGATHADNWAAATPHASNNQNIDLGGVIFAPYDDGQYSLTTQYYYAANLIDAEMDTTSYPCPVPNMATFETVGDLDSFTAAFIANGIGDEWSDFLDDTIFFVSGSMSRTHPDKGATPSGSGGMLGSTESETGYSYWVGLQTPGLTDEGRFGLEFNHGSNYWRSVTYGEDTMIGSKIATRGDAYEAYYTQNLIDRALTFQIRYTYIDYDYSGSNGFFGSVSGTPMSIADLKTGAAAGDPMSQFYGSMTVDKAQDIRAYIRYRY
jgi:hypothetical protein